MSCEGCEPQIVDYNSDTIFSWCTNCGNYAITAATKRALVAEGVTPKDAMLVYDIGCNGNGSDKIKGYRFHGLHGRALPFACGTALGNKNLTVIGSAGDGAVMSEGIGHLVHAIRNNYNLTFLIHNNANYALTKGQASATTKEHIPMNSSPDGVTADPMNIMSFVLALKPSFAARSFSGDVKHMTSMIRSGIQHNGFSVIEILQSCPSYNKATSHEWYQERVFNANEQEDYDISNLENARSIAEDLEEHVALGILYKDESKIPFSKRLKQRESYNTALVDEVKPFDVTKLFNKYR